MSSENEQTIEEMAMIYGCDVILSPDYGEMMHTESYLKGAAAQLSICEKKAQEDERVWKKRLLDEIEDALISRYNGTFKEMEEKEKYIEQVKAKYGIE